MESEVARIGIFPDSFVIRENNPQVDDIVLRVIGELYLEWIPVPFTITKNNV